MGCRWLVLKLGQSLLPSQSQDRPKSFLAASPFLTPLHCKVWNAGHEGKPGLFTQGKVGPLINDSVQFWKKGLVPISNGSGVGSSLILDAP